MTLSSGTKLGPYDIDALVGAGGMGEVYRARDARLNRIVAIKVLPKAFSEDPDRLQRFMQEARAAAALNHPNILSIYDIGEAGGSPYIVSELLEGASLREQLRGGPLPVRKAIDYALQGARGLAAAHDKGIVHRDLKPDNIFITDDGRVKILDFGLAKLTRPETPGVAGDTMTAQVKTEAGQVLGTAGYMAPEQVRGKPTDHRSDIFALGSILYEMLSGKRAFRGETPADTMSAILKEEPEELSETGRNIPAALERIVRHCLEKNPAHRFQSAGDVGFALEALADGSLTSKTGAQAVIADGRGTSAHAAAGAERAARPRPLAIGLAVAAIAGALGWWLGAGNKVDAPEYQQITFRTGAIYDARFAPDGTIIYSARWDGGERELYMSRLDEPGTRELGLKKADLVAISNKGELAIRLNSTYRGGYARSGTLARVPLSGGTPREVLDNVQDGDFAADGERMAVVRYMPDNGHWRLEYPIGKVLLDGISWISNPRISPDGKRIAFADHENPDGDDEGSVAVIDLDGHEKKLCSGYVSVEGLVWSPKGDEVWFTATKRGNSTEPQAVTLGGKLRTITNVPGGMWLEDIRDKDALVVTQQIRIRIRAMAQGEKQEQELGWLGWSIFADITNDGKKILFSEQADGGGPNYTVFLRDTSGAPPMRIGEGNALAISPDAKWVITKPKDKGTLMLVPTHAGEGRQLTHDLVTYTSAHFLPDGKGVVAEGVEEGHGYRDYLINVATGDSKPITPEGTSGVFVSPDGREVAVRTNDGIGIWSLETNSTSKIPGLDAKARFRGWSADGKSAFVAEGDLLNESAIAVSRVDIATGKVTPWKTFGGGVIAATQVTAPVVVDDGNAYAYLYDQTLSEAYVVKGLK